LRQLGFCATIGEMPEPATVTVRGSASIRAEPDEAVLWITLSALDGSPGAALSGVSGRSAQLMALLDELGVAKGDRSTAGITVEEEFDHTEQQGRRSLGYRATSRVSIRLAEPNLIGRLVTQATSDLAARVDGPRWVISLDNPVRLEAARQASADARRRADAYADGIGAKLGRLVGLSEPGTQIHRIPGAVGVRASLAEMPIQPGEHEIAAAVDATFELD
jgi:uncharacterized protein YggE